MDQPTDEVIIKFPFQIASFLHVTFHILQPLVVGFSELPLSDNLGLFLLQRFDFICDDMVFLIEQFIGALRFGAVLNERHHLLLELFDLFIIFGRFTLWGVAADNADDVLPERLHKFTLILHHAGDGRHYCLMKGVLFDGRRVFTLLGAVFQAVVAVPHRPFLPVF